MKYEICLSKEELEELDCRLEYERNVQIRKRLECIKLKNEWTRNTEISQHLGVHVSTVSTWIKDYISGGFEKLCKWNFTGRKSKLLPHKDLLEEYLTEHIVENICELRDFLLEETGIKISCCQLWRFADKVLSYSHKKTRIGPGSPEKRLSVGDQKEFIKTMDQENQGYVVLHLDGMEICHNTISGYAYQKKGKAGRKTLSSNSGRKRITIVGAVNIETKDMIVSYYEDNCDRNKIILLLEDIRAHYPNKEKVLVYLDNASYNRSYDVQEAASELDITLCYLPPYHPNFNKIESFWKYLKRKVLVNKYYSSFELLEKELNLFFCNLDKNQLDKTISSKYEIFH